MVLILQLSTKLAWMGYYYSNQAYIATTLCVNRYLPEEKCQGRCFLQNKLQKQQKQDRELPKLLKETFLGVLFASEFQQLLTGPSGWQVKQQFHCFHQTCDAQWQVGDVFQPPRFWVC